MNLRNVGLCGPIRWLRPRCSGCNLCRKWVVAVAVSYWRTRSCPRITREGRCRWNVSVLSGLTASPVSSRLFATNDDNRRVQRRSIVTVVDSGATSMWCTVANRLALFSRIYLDDNGWLFIEATIRSITGKNTITARPPFISHPLDTFEEYQGNPGGEGGYQEKMILPY